MAGGATYLSLQSGTTAWTPRDNAAVVAMPPGSFVLRFNLVAWEPYLASSLLGAETLLAIPNPAPFPLRWQGVPWGPPP